MFLSASTLSDVKYSFQLFERKGVWAAPLHLFWWFWFVCLSLFLTFVWSGQYSSIETQCKVFHTSVIGKTGHRRRGDKDTSLSAI